MDEGIRAAAPGVSVTACAHGGHLLTWTTNGVERLWMSPLSECSGGGAIRGGVPVLFPQFGTFGGLPKHGFARTRAWHLLESPGLPGLAVLRFELAHDDETLAIWPHEFRARLELAASPTELRMRLVVDNLGHQLAEFTAGLHTYLRVADPQAWISGVMGGKVWDGQSVSDPQFTQPIGPTVAALAEQDLVMHGVVAPLELHDGQLGVLRVSAQGFPNRVIWNPGPDHGLPDVPPGGAAGFVCIEPAAVTPIRVPGGGTWEGSQRLTVVAAPEA